MTDGRQHETTPLYVTAGWFPLFHDDVAAALCPYTSRTATQTER